MADSSDPETTQFPSVQTPPDSVVPAGGGKPARSPGNRGSGAVIALLVLLLVIIVAAVVWLFSGPGGDGSAASTAPAADMTVTETAPGIPETMVSPTADATTAESTPETPAPVGRPTDPVLPGGHSPVNDAARSNTPAGDLNNVYTGTSTTSPGFALNVRDAFVRYYLDTGELNGQVRATSPATGMTYDVDCVDNGEFVTCTAGDNAVIYIS